MAANLTVQQELGNVLGHTYRKESSMLKCSLQDEAMMDMKLDRRSVAKMRSVKCS